MSVYFLYSGPNVVLLLFIIALLGGMSLNPVVTYFKIFKQHYYITDKRAIVVEENGNCYYMNLGNAGDYRIYRTETDGATLAIGSALLAENEQYISGELSI